MRWYLRSRFRALAPFLAALTALFLTANQALAATAGTPAAVGPTSLGTALNGIQGLLFQLALPSAGIGLAGGGVWHAVAHDPQGQEGAKRLMKASVVGACVTILASAILSGVSSALGA
jgi:hypothetical protein